MSSYIITTELFSRYLKKYDLNTGELVETILGTTDDQLCSSVTADSSGALYTLLGMSGRVCKIADGAVQNLTVSAIGRITSLKVFDDCLWTTSKTLQTHFIQKHNLNGSQISNILTEHPGVFSVTAQDSQGNIYVAFGGRDGHRYIDFYRINDSHTDLSLSFSFDASYAVLNSFDIIDGKFYFGVRNYFGGAFIVTDSSGNYIEAIGETTANVEEYGLPGKFFCGGGVFKAGGKLHFLDYEASYFIDEPGHYGVHILDQGSWGGVVDIIKGSDLSEYYLSVPPAPQDCPRWTGQGAMDGEVAVSFVVIGPPEPDPEQGDSPEQNDPSVEAYSPIPIDVFIDLLPTWFHVNSGEGPRDTGYWKVIHALCDTVSRTSGIISMVDSEKWLAHSSISYPRLLWRAKAKHQLSDGLSMSVKLQIEGDEEPTILRRASSTFDLIFSPDPVYLPSNDGYIYMRNLAVVDDTIDCTAGDVVLTEGTLLPDEQVWVSVAGKWQRLTSEGQVDYKSNSVYVPIDGKYTFRYSTAERLATIQSACIQVDNDPPVQPVCHDMWNPYDEAALHVSLNRIPGEDNGSLSERIKIGYLLMRKDNDRLVEAQIGHELGLVGTLKWDGKTTIDFGALGIDHVKHVAVLELPKQKTARKEILSADPDGQSFVSVSNDWDPGWLIFLNDTHVTTKTFPNMTVQDGYVDFGVKVSGRVSASYTAQTYEVDTSGGNTRLLATPNTPPGTYTVLYLRELTASSAANLSFINSLIDAEGKPTDSYNLLASSVAAEAPVFIGTTNWGRDAHWFDDMELIPEISHLPTPIK